MSAQRPDPAAARPADTPPPEPAAPPGGDAPRDPEAARARRRAQVLLARVPGIGPRLRQALLEAFGTPEAIVSAAPSALRAVPGIGPKLVEAFRRTRDEVDPEAELAACAAAGIAIVTIDEPEYPARLRELPDPPGVLYLKGSFEPRDAAAVAIVGSRHATHYGRKHAGLLAGSLARAGLTIVSGLARGIDAAAHQAALDAGGRTIAVLASGVEEIYPPEHRELAHDVVRAGCLVSETPHGAQPMRGMFPQRNRLISGLSLGTVVVEASDRSGALITARHAMEQGREVFALPGPVDSRMSRGCHRLLRDGAKLVETADDVLEELGPLPVPAPRAAGPDLHHPAELLLNEPETRVLGAIDPQPTPIDAVVVRSGLPTPQVLATLAVLEMRRLVKRVGGSSVLRP